MKKSKNPMQYNDENIRRWMVINLPKYMPNFEDEFWVQGKLVTDLIKFFKLDPYSVRRNYIIENNVEIRIHPYLTFARNLGVLKIPRIQKMKYWKYYTKSLDRTLDIMQQGRELSGESPRWSQKLGSWKQLLEDNYEKD